MIEQLLYLVEIAALPNVTLQIVEHSAGAYSLLTGSVVLLGYEDDGDDESKSAYVASHGGGVTLEDADEVEALAAQFEAAANIALSHDDSVKFVERRIEVLRGAARQS
ncbi:hypothetical protein LX90_003699 [Lentzea flava]|nr:hypothetical protein [Lentzea flava]